MPIGGLRHSPEALWGHTCRLVHSRIYSSYPTPWNSLCSSRVRSQGQVLPQCWWLGFLARETGRSGLTQASDPVIISWVHGPKLSTSQLHACPSTTRGQWKNHSRCLPGALGPNDRGPVWTQSPGMWLAIRTDAVHQAGLGPCPLSTWTKPAVEGSIPTAGPQGSLLESPKLMSILSCHSCVI